MTVLNPRVTKTESNARIPTVRLRGPFDKWGAVKLRFRLLLRLARGCKTVILDMKRVPYIDSDGVRTLKTLQADYSDVSFELVNANRNVQRTLRIAMMDELLKAS